MKNVSWPLASMVIAAMVVIGIVAVTGGDIIAVSSAIMTLLIALGLVELREIKTSTNGNTSNLMEQNRALLQELAEYRRASAQLTAQAVLPPPPPPPTPMPVQAPPAPFPTSAPGTPDLYLGPPTYPGQ